MADSNFFTSGGFGSALTTVGGITTGFLKNANDKIQGEYATALTKLQNDAALTESDRQQKIAALNARYQQLVQQGQDEAREDYLKWGLLIGGFGLAGLVVWLSFGKKKK